MGNRRIISSIVGILVLCGMGMVIMGYQKKELPVRIAACPTFWNTIYQMDILGRETRSTSESLHLLSRGYVDYVLAGRTPKLREWNGNYIMFGSGYSFLSKESATISDEELQTMKFFTDLEDGENIKNIFGIKNLEHVEHIYDQIENSIIITSWENTDYSKADIVHVLHPDGSRYIESRIPVLYCREQCDQGIISEVKRILSYK